MPPQTPDDSMSASNSHRGKQENGFSGRTLRTKVAERDTTWQDGRWCPLFRLFITGFLAADLRQISEQGLRPNPLSSCTTCFKVALCNACVAVVLINASALATGEEAAMDVGR